MSIRILKKTVLITRQLLFHDFFFFLLCVVALYGVVFGTIYNNYQRAPSDRYYWGNENYPLDIAGDLAYVKLGFNGHWQSFVNYSSTLPVNKSFLKFDYILLGHIARVLHMDTLLVFYEGRTLLSLFYLCTMYFIIRKIFLKPYERIVATLLAIFSTGITVTGWKNEFNIIPINDITVFARTTVAANHYMLSGACILLSLYFLSRVLDNPQDKRSFILSAITGFITSLLFAPDMVIVFSTIPMVFIAKIFLHKPFNKNTIITWAGILFFYSIIVSLPLLYLRSMPVHWKGVSAETNMEKLNPFHVDFQNYILALGGTYILGFFSLPTIIKKKNTLLLFFASWLIAHPVGEFIFSDLIEINRIRYFLSPYFFVFAILATVGIRWLSETAATIHKKASYGVIVLLTIICLGLGYNSYIHSQSLLTVCYCYQNPFDFAYPKKTIMEGIWWLRDHTTEHDIVLSDAFVGTLIPAFAGNRVYLSWWHNLTGDQGYYKNLYAIQAFYYGGLNKESVDRFLKDNGITYVFYSENERNMNRNQEDLGYTSLQIVHRSGDTIVYKAIPSTAN